MKSVSYFEVGFRQEKMITTRSSALSVTHGFEKSFLSLSTASCSRTGGETAFCSEAVRLSREFSIGFDVSRRRSSLYGAERDDRLTFHVQVNTSSFQTAVGDG